MTRKSEIGGGWASSPETAYIVMDDGGFFLRNLETAGDRVGGNWTIELGKAGVIPGGTELDALAQMIRSYHPIVLIDVADLMTETGGELPS